ncbi:MAG: hypothetical protein HY543_07175 [Deltaproteobacteria bacterium]|nr:hypothetical protein [Deltaproteobacteria bacterium]
MADHPTLTTICEAAWAKLLPLVDASQKTEFIKECRINGQFSLDLPEEDQCWAFVEDGKINFWEFPTIEEKAVCLKKSALRKKWVTPKEAEPVPGIAWTAAFETWRMYASIGVGGNFIGGLSVDGNDPVIDRSAVDIRTAFGFLLKPSELGHDAEGTAWAFRNNLAVAFEDNIHLENGSYVYSVWGLAPRYTAEFVAQLTDWRLIIGTGAALYFGALTTQRDLDVGIETRLYRTDPSVFVFRLQTGLEIGAELPTLFLASEKVVPFFTIGGGVNMWFKGGKPSNPPEDRQDINTGPKLVTGDMHLDAGIHF